MLFPYNDFGFQLNCDSVDLKWDATAQFSSIFSRTLTATSLQSLLFFLNPLAQKEVLKKTKKASGGEGIHPKGEVHYKTEALK